jgi:hypothetical protein
VLVKAALAHAQFETIHRFLDGNDYDHLQRVRTDGSWEEWLRFFLDGVIEVAESTTDATQRIVAMIERDPQAIHGMGRGAATAHRVHDLAARYVVVRPAATARALELTDPPVYNAISRLEAAGILREVTGRQRGKAYVYDQYLALLNEGTEPLLGRRLGFSQRRWATVMRCCPRGEEGRARPNAWLCGLFATAAAVPILTAIHKIL